MFRINKIKHSLCLSLKVTTVKSFVLEDTDCKILQYRAHKLSGKELQVFNLMYTYISNIQSHSLFGRAG